MRSGYQERQRVSAKVCEGHLLVSLHLGSIVSSVDLEGLLMSRTGTRLPLRMAGMPREFTKKQLESRKTAKLLRLRHLCGKRPQVLKSNSQRFFHEGKTLLGDTFGLSGSVIAVECH